MQELFCFVSAGEVLISFASPQIKYDHLAVEAPFGRAIYLLDPTLCVWRHFGKENLECQLLRSAVFG